MKSVGDAGRAPWWSSRTSQRWVQFVAQLLIEFLPVEAILVVVSGYNGQDITQSPVPVWFLLGTLLLSSGLGRYLIGISLPRLIAVSSPLLLVCALVLIRISPALYGSSGHGFFDWSWVFAFGNDMVDHRSVATALPPLLLLLAYIWWRGLLLGSDPPDYSTVMRRFKYGMVAMVAATVATIALPGVLQQHVAGVLGFLLPAEVFSGLVAAALGRMAFNHTDNDRDAYIVTNDRVWLGTALTLALVAVGFALVINLIINYQSVGSLLALLGPVGPLASKLASALVEGLAQLLRFLFGWLFSSFKPVQGGTSAQPSVSTVVGKKHTASKPLILPRLWLEIAGIILEVAAIAAVIILFLWLIRTLITRRRPPEAVLEEERESLDAASIFSNQLRGFLAGLRPVRASNWVDPLTPGSVRYVYRTFLEAASKRGLRRRPDETPDEYATRLSTIPALGGSELQQAGELTPLASVNQSYNSARYAEHQLPEEEMPEVRKRAKILIRQLQQ